MSEENLNRTNDDRRAESAISNPVVLGGATFVLGFVAGLLLRDTVGQIYEQARRGTRHRPGRTIVYDENLPDSLARREPAPDPGQPRFGGTGAIGVSPRAVDPAVGHVE